jgi:putative restriction endonuclease
MRGFVANTDYQWYEFLSARPDIDEVNFWQPGGEREFKILRPGQPVLFRLKSPHNAIAGVGFFVQFSILPVSLAWAAFSVKNGAESERAMRDRVEKYRRRFDKGTGPGEDYRIGCILLAEPTFFPAGSWVREPRDWSPQIVQGRTLDLSTGEGLRIWTEVMDRIGRRRVIAERAPEGRRYGAAQVIQPRLGQGIFRVLVTDVYRRRCAVTGERTLPVLEAAHVRPYAEGGRHELSNGILLRSDLHTLFDRGYLTITPNYHIEVSRRIRDEFENGRDYYALHGRDVKVPAGHDERPAPILLDLHNTHKFKG